MNSHATSFRPEQQSVLVDSPTTIVWSASNQVLELGGTYGLEGTANTPPGFHIRNALRDQFSSADAVQTGSTTRVN